MIRRAFVVIAVIVVVLMARPVYETGLGFGFWQPFTRPPGVSKQACYVSAFKLGATWFDCSVDRLRDVDVCRAWDEFGRLLAYGKYRLDGENRAATIQELRPSTVMRNYDRPDLSWIYLSGESGWHDKTLVPVNDAGQPLERFEVH